MATGDDLPLLQGAGMGSRLVSVDTEACGGGTPDLGSFSGVSVFIGIFGVGTPDHQKLARQLDSVWYSFSVKLKNKEKQKLALGSRLIG